MLLQSHEGFLRLLPALPRIWDRGSLVARGNFFASCWWERGILPEKERTAGSFCRRGWRQLGPQVNGKRRSSGFRRRSERGTNLFGGGRLLICGKFVGKGRQLPDRAVLWYNVAYTEQGFRREAGSSWQVDAWED